MKTQFIFTFLNYLLLLILFSNISYSQETGVKTLPPVTVTSKTTTAAVTEKVAKAFKVAFKDAEDPKWVKLNKDFLVNFIMNQQQNTALFRKNGIVIYHLAFGGEKSLPADIRKIIKPNYYDYNITKVVKVNEADRNIWVVNMEDAKNFVIVRVEDGELEEVQNLKKG
ncbi:MAG: hypothetical protein WKG06_24035 [Segetibacter sp.]